MRWAALALLVGCYQPKADPACSITCTSETECPSGLHCGTDGLCGPTSDGRCIDSVGDGGPDTPDAMEVGICYGTGIRICFPEAPTGMVDAQSECTPMTLVDGTPVCAYAGVEVVINQDIAFTSGGVPIVYVGVQGITITANVAVSSSTANATLGPGANSSACNVGPSPVTVDAGGSGGSFQGNGGTGAGEITGTVAGAAIAPAFHGGCRGGDTTGSNGLGKGGDSGGAIYFLSPDHIMLLSGSINASGAGGHSGEGGLGPGAGLGGGGGGSGGYVGLDSPIVALGSFVVLAQGGGGGGGGDTSNGRIGNEATPGNPIGTGGQPGTIDQGGTGGNGSDATIHGSDGSGSVTADGGGGGGGAAGYIQLFDTADECVPPACRPESS